MQQLFFTILFLLSLSSFSQEKKTLDILTFEDNEKWISNFKKLPDFVKIQNIKEKIISDKKYNSRLPENHCFGIMDKFAHRYSDETYRYECKYLFYLIVGKKLYLLNLLYNPNSLLYLNLLNPKKGFKITIKETKNLKYHGFCDFIHIKIIDKKIIKEIKQNIKYIQKRQKPYLN